MEAHCFETMVEDLRKLLREYAGRKPKPPAYFCFNSRPNGFRSNSLYGELAECTCSGLLQQVPRQYQELFF